MPKYQIDVPGSGTFEVDSPSDLTDLQAYQAVMGQIRNTPAPKGGIAGALGLGTKSLLGSQLTGIKGIFGNANEAAQQGIARQEQLGQEYTAPTSLEAVKKAYQEKGLLSAAGEVATQIPKAIAQQAPQLAETFAGARMGAMVAGPWGAVAGAAIPNLVQFFGTNLERQAQKQIKSGQPVNVEAGKAALTAPLQTAVDLVETRLLFGSKFLSSALGISEKSLAKMSTEAVEKQAQEKLLPLILKGTAKGAVTQIPSEIAQQMLERVQAGLPLTTPDAVTEYGNTAYQVGLLGPLGIAGRAGTRGAARDELSKRAGKAAADAALEQDYQEGIAPTAPDATGQMGLNLTGAQEVAGPRMPVANQELQRNLFALQQQQQTPEVQQQIAALQGQINQPQTQLAELRSQYDTLERELDRLRSAHSLEKDPAKKQAILVQAQKLDYARQELEGQLKGAPARPGEQMGLNFEYPPIEAIAPTQKTRLGEPPIIGQQPQAQTGLTPEQELEFAKQRLASGAPLTPAQELLVRQAQGQERAAQQTAPSPQLEIPNVVGAGARPTSYVVDDAALDTFGFSKAATKIKNDLRGLDLMNPEDAAKFDDLVAKHERKNAKIDMDAVEAFRSEKPEPVAAREVPEREPLPARPYDARKAYQQAREAQFAFGQTASPLSPKDVRAQAKAQNEPDIGAGPVDRTDERGVSVPSTGVPSAEGTTTPTPTGVGSTVGTTEQPDGGAPPSRKAGPSPLAQMAQQVAPASKRAIRQKAVPRVETKEALEDQLAKEELSADTEALMKELGIEPAERKPTTYRVAATETNGLTKERVDNIVKAVTAGWKNAPEIRVVQSEMQLPPAIQAQIKRDGVRRPEGVWSDQDNCVFLIAGNIATAKNAVLTIAHETVGHFGLRSILGDRYLAAMNRIYEGNKTVREYADNKIDRGMDPATAVEEVLAELAETQPNPTLMQNIIAAIRKVLNAVGFPLKSVTNSEILALLKASRQFVIEGKGKAGKGGIQIGKVFSADGPLFYSRLGAMVQHAPKELSKGATGAQWAKWINSNAGKFGVKAEEIEWSGINDLLALMSDDNKFTTKAVADMLKEEGVKVDEVVRAEPKVDTAKIDEIQNQRAQLNIDRKELEKEQNKLASEINKKKLLIDNEFNRAQLENFKEDLGINQISKVIVQGISDNTFTIEDFKPGEGARLYDEIVDRQIKINKIWQEQSRLHGEIGKIENEAGEDERRFGGWTTEPYDKGGRGGKNYTEMVITLPQPEPKMVRNQHGHYDIYDDKGKVFMSDIQTKHSAEKILNDVRSTLTGGPKYEQPYHWPNVWNPVVHIRFNEKTDKKGNKVLFVEELQSDWGQAGKDRGFSKEEHAQKVKEAEQRAYEAEDAYEKAVFAHEEDQATKEYAVREVNPRELKDLAEALNEARLEVRELEVAGPVANSPFVRKPEAYTALAIKRLLRYAADNGYNKISFINGEMAHKRFPQTQKGKSTEGGMRTHYDVRIPSVAKDVLRKLGAESNVGTEKIKISKDNKSYYVKLFNGSEIGPYRNQLEAIDNILQVYENTYGRPVLTENLMNPEAPGEVYLHAGDILSGQDIYELDMIGFDVPYVLGHQVEQPLKTEMVTKTDKGTRELFTINLAPETAAKVKEGQALFREARTPEGKSAESLMTAFGGKPQEQERSFLEKKMGSFNKAKDAWTDSYKQNNDWVASTFGKGQNIASFDQAFNNRIYNQVMGEAKKGNLAFENAKKALLRISTSQALHRGNLANQIIELGDYKYDSVINRWEAVDAKDGVSMSKFEDLIKSLATKLGVEPNRARQIMGAAYEANRLNGMYKSLDQTEKDITLLEKELSSLRKNRKRTKAEQNVIDLKTARLDQLKDKEEDLNNKIQHKTKAQVDAGMELYNAYPEIKEGTKVWNKMRERVVKLLVETGVKTEEEAERWLDEAAYVPFFRDMEEQKQAGPQVMARGLRESMIDHRMKGSMREVQDPIENMYQWMQWSISRAVSNKQLQVMIEQYKAVLPEEVREGEGGHGNTFTIYYDGTARKFNVADPAIAQAFVGLEPIIFPGIGAAVKATNALRHIITRFPVFSAVQLFSDSYTAMYTSGLKSPFGVLKEIAKEVARTAQGTSETRDVLTKAGILETHDYSAMNEEDAIAKRLDLNTPSGYRKLMNNLDRLSSASDNVIRQGIYNQAIKEKLSHAEAMEKAAEVVNFRRISGDPRLQFASRVIPFFNAYLQVGSVAVKTLTGRGISPTERKAAQATLIATSAKIAMLSLLYSMAIGDDEDYKRKNRVTRDRMFMIPGTGGYGIPIRADVFALPKIVGEYGYQMMADKGTTDPKMFKEAMARAVMNSLHPPSEGIPQIVRPALGVMTNHDFFQDREIVNATMRRLDVDRQFTKNTSELAKALGALSGMSPLNIDYLLRGYFGSAMTLTALATNDALNVARGGPPLPEKSAKDMIAALPNMSAFISKDENTAVLSDFYEAARDINKASATLKSMKHLPIAEQKAYREEHKEELRLKPMVQTLEKQLVLLKQREQMVRESTKMDDAKKRAELKRINDQRDRMVKNVTKLRQKLYD